MIPTTWFRRLILAVFVVEVGATILWLASLAVTDKADKAFAQTVAGLVILLVVYTAGPLTARFLAPVASSSRPLTERLQAAEAATAIGLPVFLYDHKDVNAVTVGMLQRHSRVYVTSGMVERVSDAGLEAVLAHEATHAREHHILISFTYACCYAMVAHATDSDGLFLIGFLGFMALRRWSEYRADAGAAAAVGKQNTITMLEELSLVYKTPKVARWLSFASPYPTLPMRIEAVRTGKGRLI